ncbi:hypothetical protein [Acetobacter fallax]|uniref:Uncharacterized protein n=1 Tax=Acetobacter fallax TaxID=1737473 RepID=A0ABX0K5E2_9PROT|nr:hypothetical protein [Acetobacter fallax]NHO31519.1 hypothetical protein [Acetobacter fallax]NHO35078.1 hypothetical protein [Acetobacter fallax]
MHMLAASLSGIALAMVVSLVTPHYAPAAFVVAVIYTVLGLLSSWITIHEVISD